MLFDTVRNAFKRYLHNSSGVTAIIFGLASMVLFLMAGAAVDFSQALSVRQKLGNALDAAALAVGSSGTLDEDDARDLAEDVFYANFPADEIGTPGELTINLAEQVVTLSATASVDTAFLGIIGTNVLNVGMSTEVTREGKNLEIVMVLDNTGSMSGSKIADLKVAADLLVDIVMGNTATSDHAKIGLVPFAASVNIGADRALSSGWIDVNGQSSVNAYNFQSDTNIYELWQDMETTSNIEWRGCVMARNEKNGYKYDVLDVPSNIADPETLWVQYLYPDEPDKSGYNNSYFNDKTGGSVDKRQRNEGKYDDGQSVSNSRGPNYNCPERPIVPMTNVKAILTDAIENMLAEYTTNIATGLVWGWRVISPSQPFNEGASYTDDDYIKSIILLTDGDNVISSRNNHNESDFSGYNFVADGRLGTTTSANAAVDELDDKTSEICENIKAKGIILYTITFQVSSNSTKNLMKNCASSDEKYFDSPSGDQLSNIFGIIAKELSNLRISK